ncbi:MAG TPA: polymer-forming cytoskeletal protein [Dehalococcoidia bacterium]|nr:polymer-forming cytoskeletal protein [Dehalococcoidia bacterium]
MKMKRTAVFLAALVVALMPFPAQAQEEDEGFVLRVRGDVRIARGEVVETVIVINGNAFVEGTVTGGLVVIDGTASVTGEVRGGTTVISGNLELRDGARVHDVTLVRSDLQRSGGATITGNLRERENLVFPGAWAVVSILAWLGLTVAVIAAGLVFAAIGGRQLQAASLSLTEAAGSAVVAAVVLWVGVPVAAFMVMATLVGIPLGIGALLFLLPAMWLLGYIAAATRLGMLVAGQGGGESPHPYAAAAVGLLITQLVAIVPGLGALVVGLAGLWGAGGIALVAYRAARGTRRAPADAAASPAA